MLRYWGWVRDFLLSSIHVWQFVTSTYTLDFGGESNKVPRWQSKQHNIPGGHFCPRKTDWWELRWGFQVFNWVYCPAIPCKACVLLKSMSKMIGDTVPISAWKRLLWKMSITLWMECLSCRSSVLFNFVRYSSRSERARCASRKQAQKSLLRYRRTWEENM